MAGEDTTVGPPEQRWLTGGAGGNRAARRELLKAGKDRRAGEADHGLRSGAGMQDVPDDGRVEQRGGVAELRRVPVPVDREQALVAGVDGAPVTGAAVFFAVKVKQAETMPYGIVKRLQSNEPCGHLRADRSHVFVLAVQLEGALLLGHK